MGLKKHLPWWVRIGAKIILSRIPVSYATWRKLGLFRHGDMQNPEHALRTFKSHFERAASIQNIPKEFVSLELGPGDSLLSGVIAKAFGASRTYLVDTGRFAVQSVEPYQRLATILRKEYKMTMPSLENCSTLEDVMNVCDMIYLTEGVASLACIPEKSVDFIWSQVVLEHVPRMQFHDLLQQLSRIAKGTSVSSHSVDLRDHLGGGLNNLRFSADFWESRFMSESGFYTNRFRYSEIMKMFGEAGFEVLMVNPCAWETLPINKSKMARQFSAMDEQDLLVSEFEVVLKTR